MLENSSGMFNSPFSICQSAIEFEIPTRPGHWHGMQRRAGQGQPGLDNILMKELDYIEQNHLDDVGDTFHHFNCSSRGPALERNISRGNEGMCE